MLKIKTIHKSSVKLVIDEPDVGRVGIWERHNDGDWFFFPAIDIPFSPERLREILSIQEHYNG